MGIMKLANKYSYEYLENACKKADLYSASVSQNIQAILSLGQKQFTEQPEEHPSSSQHGFTRGAEYYIGREK